MWIWWNRFWEAYKSENAVRVPKMMCLFYLCIATVVLDGFNKILKMS